MKRIDLAAELGIEKVLISTGIDRGWDWDEKFDFYDGIRKRPIRSLEKVVELFKPILELAEKKNIKNRLGNMSGHGKYCDFSISD